LGWIFLYADYIALWRNAQGRLWIYPEGAQNEKAGDAPGLLVV